MINVHIERMMIEGLPVARRDARRIRAAVEAELARLIAESGLAGDVASGGALPFIIAPRLQFAARTDPVTLGRRIAQSIHGGIGGAA